MPKLRRLSGKQVIAILHTLGFEVYSQKGSHVRLQRVTAQGDEQRLLSAIHGSKTIPSGTLHTSTARPAGSAQKMSCANFLY